MQTKEVDFQEFDAPHEWREIEREKQGGAPFTFKIPQTGKRKKGS